MNGKERNGEDRNGKAERNGKERLWLLSNKHTAQTDMPVFVEM